MTDPAGPRTWLIDAMGIVVAVEVSGDRADEVLDRLPSLWELCAVRGSPAPDATLRVVHDTDAATRQAGERAGALTSPNLEDLLQVLTQRVTVAAIDALAGRHFMLHAACLASPVDGRAAAFVAPGGTGKTTLVRTLGPGRRYVTDETVAVSDDGTVHPYPKPLSIRRTPTSLWKNETPPRRLDLVAPTGRVHLAALCLLERDDGHPATPRLETLTTLDAVVALVPQMSHLPALTRPLQRLATLVESLGGVHRVTYREAADLAALVDEWTGLAS